MRKVCVALLLVPLAQSIALAQTNTAAPAGDPQAGKALWEGNLTQCRNCHGTKGEGAFGPDLAGRAITPAQFRQAVRKPWGIMPAFIDTQVSDADLANLSAYFVSLPANPAPGKWRFEAPAGAPRGQVVLINMGCGQCHGPELDGPRGNLGAVDADFDYFKNLVYNHTTALPQHERLLGEEPTAHIRMGNFNPTRVWESQLHEIYDWARNDAGFRVRVQGKLSAGVPSAAGVTYTLNMANAGLPGKGLTAEDLTIGLVIPAGIDVVTATGDGYQGVHADEQAKGRVAEWKVPRLAPKDRQSYTITLSRAPTAADNLRGNIRWTKPAIKPEPFDQSNIAAAPL
jgi:mono/diheme cytochrome c family protein